MSNSSPGRVNADQLEKALIAAVLGSVLLLQVLFKGQDSYITLLMTIHALAFAGLILLYIKTGTNDYWRFFVLALIVNPVATLVMLYTDESLLQIFTWVQLSVFGIAGALFLFQAIKKSKEYKTFESLGFLLGAFLLFRPTLSVLTGNNFQAFPLLFNFGTAFVIGTLMYNENLWDQYKKNQQKFILLTLLICLVNIIAIVTKQF